MKKRVRIKDIANRAGVSTGTVDRVLHNRGSVAPEVKKKVLQVVDELGYERNRLASALAYNKAFRILALLPEPEKDSYWKQIHNGVQKAAKAVKHYGLLVEPMYFDLFQPQDFHAKAQQLIAAQPDGLLFPPMFYEEAKWLLDTCQQQNIPQVIINTSIEGNHPLCYIGQDSYQSGVLGARLLDFGLTDGQMVCILNLEVGTKAAHHLLDKEKGFRSYFANGGNKEVDILRKDFEAFNDPAKLSEFLQNLTTSHPRLSGIFVTNSRAHKVINCLPEASAGEIKIVGFDLIESNLRYLQEDKINFLINQNPVEQGYLGIINLFKHLVLKEEVERTQYLPLDIIVKENVEYYLRKQLTFEMAL
ncbi:MAG: LacI family DNA-binding transcriptional regulator [Bacteroidota bacterium]